MDMMFYNLRLKQILYIIVFGGIFTTSVMYWIQFRISRSDNDVISLKKELEFYKQQCIEKKSVIDSKIHVLERDYKTDKDALERFVKSVTVLIYNDFESSACLTSQIREVRKVLPGIKIIITSVLQPVITEDIPEAEVSVLKGSFSEGKALNIMISLVKTDNFLYLSRGAVPVDFNSDNGPGWLLHALDSIPDLDFVGGAYLWYNSTLPYHQYEIQCYRLRMCHWVFSQTYEYQFSVGDMMACEETSMSFMGRTRSVAKVGQFDPYITDMVTTDFFWQAKLKANVFVGLRPEVFFNVTKTCSRPHPSPIAQTSKRQPFMEKYDLRIIRDSYGRETWYPKGMSVAGGFNHKRDGGIMTPLSYKMMQTLLHIGDDFFKLHNVTYFLDAGIPLGAVKVRGILPWDGAGDIDTGYYGMKWQDMQEHLRKFCPDCTFTSGPTGFGPPGLMHIDIRKPDGEDIFNEMYTHEFEPAPPPYKLLYVFVNGRDIPVPSDFMVVHRQSYGLNYLTTRHRSGKIIDCKKPGHHACLPLEFSTGAGHWSDYYCHK